MVAIYFLSKTLVILSDYPNWLACTFSLKSHMLGNNPFLKKIKKALACIKVINYKVFYNKCANSIQLSGTYYKASNT